MYSVLDVSDYIIENSSSPVSSLKLQKMLYFVQANFLVSRNRQCFPDAVMAWPSGPVVPAIFKRYLCSYSCVSA